MKLFVAITILTCLNDAERSHMLRKWIEIAVDTKTALGNLYSFTNIMLGLGVPQVIYFTTLASSVFCQNNFC